MIGIAFVPIFIVIGAINSLFKPTAAALRMLSGSAATTSLTDTVISDTASRTFMIIAVAVVLSLRVDDRDRTAANCKTDADYCCEGYEGDRKSISHE